MQSGEGGLLTTSDDHIADQLRLLRNQGMRARYQYEMPGYNWRLTDVQAAEELNEARQALFRRVPAHNN